MNTIAPIKTFEYDRPVGGVCSTAEAWARTPTPSKSPRRSPEGPHPQAC
jgi:hypothetical protein